MAPKKKKLSKKEKLEAQRKAEEEARLVEEKRLRLEQEECERNEAEQRRKQELYERNCRMERERLETERNFRLEELKEIAKLKQDAVDKAAEAWEWERYWACKKTPDPFNKSEMNDFYETLNEWKPQSVDEALKLFELLAEVIEDCRDIHSEQDGVEESVFLKEALRMKELLLRKQAQATAYLLQFHFKTERGDDVIEERSSRFGYALWFNLERSSRNRKLHFYELGLQIEVPKQIAMSPICLTIQILEDETAIKPVEYLNASIGKLEAGKTFPKDTTPFTIVLPRRRYKRASEKEDKTDSAGLQVGLWEEFSRQWSFEGIGEVRENADSDTISFTTTRLGVFAVLYPISHWFPYKSWFLGPTPDTTSSVQLTVAVRNGTAITFEVKAEGVRIKEPVLHYLDKWRTPKKLLDLLQYEALCVVPTGGAASGFSSHAQMETASETQFCQDISYLCLGLYASQSKWNAVKELGTNLICRISQTDSFKDISEPVNREPVATEDEVAAISPKALSLMRKGSKGVTLVNDMEADSEFKELPGYESEEYGQSLFGELHFDSVALLRTIETSNEKLDLTSGIMERIHDTDPKLSNTLSDLLLCLHLFNSG